MKAVWAETRFYPEKTRYALCSGDRQGHHTQLSGEALSFQEIEFEAAVRGYEISDVCSVRTENGCIMYRQAAKEDRMSHTAEIFENDEGETVVVYDRLASDWLRSRPNPDAVRKVFGSREEAVLNVAAEGYVFRRRYMTGFICGEAVKGCQEEFWEKLWEQQ